MIINRPPFTIHHFASLDSTNDRLKEMARAPEFTCVVADEQTAGRGRRERSWHSSPGDGLYLSVLLRPSAESSAKIPLISLLAAIAVAEALIARGVAGVDIKWPNDTLVNGRKISGVLAEAVSAGSESSRVILGVGVNLNHRSFPPELRETATSVAIETGERVGVDEFRDQLLAKLAHWYEVWSRERSDVIVNRWQQLSSYARGQRVTVTLDNEQLAGVTAGLTEHGALRLMTDDGATRCILAGEVARVRKAEKNSADRKMKRAPARTEKCETEK